MNVQLVKGEDGLKLKIVTSNSLNQSAVHQQPAQHDHHLRKIGRIYFAKIIMGTCQTKKQTMYFI